MSFSVFSSSPLSSQSTGIVHADAPLCIKLVDNVAYQEFLSIHPVTSPVDIHHLSFTSQFANARNPDALQTRYQLNLSRATLEALNHFLDQYLKLTGEDGHVCN